jgi:hypothetical protein
VRALALLLAAALPLSACGLQPMYAGGGSGPVAQGLAAVEVAPIEGRAGWLVRNALNDRLAQSGSAQAPRYRLDVLLDDKLEGLGLLGDDTIGRERRTLRARYQLVDLASGKSCSTPLPVPTPASTLFRANMRPSPPSRRRSKTSRGTWPTGSSRGWR